VCQRGGGNGSCNRLNLKREKLEKLKKSERRVRHVVVKMAREPERLNKRSPRWVNRLRTKEEKTRDEPTSHRRERGNGNNAPGQLYYQIPLLPNVGTKSANREILTRSYQKKESQPLECRPLIVSIRRVLGKKKRSW